MQSKVFNHALAQMLLAIIMLSQRLFMIVEQIFLSPQVKRRVIIRN